MQPIAHDVRRELAAIFAGGALGTLARAGLVEAFPPAPGQVVGPALFPTAVGICLGIGSAIMLVRSLAVSLSPGRVHQDGCSTIAPLVLRPGAHWPTDCAETDTPCRTGLRVARHITTRGLRTDNSAYSRPQN